MINADRPEVPTSPRDMLTRTRRRAMQLRRRRRWAVAAASAVVVAAAVTVPLVVAGHGQSGKVVQVIGSPTTVPATITTTPTTATGGTTPTSATTAGNPGGSTPGSTPTTSVTTQPVLAGCTSSQLSARLTAPNGAAGSVGYELQLVNTGSVACTIGGYPGVSYVGVTGATVGAPASRTVPGTARLVTLAPGGIAEAVLLAVDSYNYPSTTCQLMHVKGLRIYPPNQTVALLIPQSGQACANPADPVLRVGPLGAAPAQG